MTGLTTEAFGTADGQPVNVYRLLNAHGIEVRITNFGGTIVSLKTPNRDGRFADIVLGFENLNGYLGKEPYFGATIGRYGNRIAKGLFTLDGKQYTLARNNGENALHGGLKGFDKRVWQPRDASSPGAPALELKYVSPDGEEGYPGTLTSLVTFTLRDDDTLTIDYQATTDKTTVLNLTNHSYFNLKGQGQGDILDHQMMIAADRFTPVDAGLIPTGELRSVAGTPFDFRQPTAIGARINASDEQLKLGKGYDHNFVLNHAAGQRGVAARVLEPTTGRVLEIETTEPGVQFYTGNFLDGTVQGKGGEPYPFRGGFCLETQHFPDSPNHPDFPSTVLKPGQKYTSTTVWRFTTDRSK